MLTLFALVLAGCGDDEGGGSVQAYCEKAAALDAQDDFPSDQQIKELQDAAPEPIKEDVDAAGDVLIEKGEDAFEDKAVQERIERIEKFEADTCGLKEGEGEEAAIPDDARPVEVIGVEYAFQNLPEEVQAGTYRVTFKNEGKEDHEIGIVELNEGVTADQVIELFKQGKESEGEKLIADDDVGGSHGPIKPGESKDFAVELEAGKTYGYACFVDAPNDGPPHAALGMYGDFRTT